MGDPNIFGINHIGMTVPDLETATVFLQQAFGAEVIYESFGPSDPPREGEEFEKVTGAAKGTQVRGQRLVRIGYGPDLELFEMHGPDQAQPIRASDFGLAHLGLYAVDIVAAVEKFKRAGGVTYSEPRSIPYTTEKGPRNRVCYGHTPWGTTVEFFSAPDAMAYREGTTLRRWQDDGYGLAPSKS